MRTEKGEEYVFDNTISEAETLALPSASLEERDPMPTDGKTAKQEERCDYRTTVQ